MNSAYQLKSSYSVKKKITLILSEICTKSLRSLHDYMEGFLFPKNTHINKEYLNGWQISWFCYTRGTVIEVVRNNLPHGLTEYRKVSLVLRIGLQVSDSHTLHLYTWEFSSTWTSLSNVTGFFVFIFNYGSLPIMLKALNRVPKHHFPKVIKGFSVPGTYFRAVVTPSISGLRPHIAVVIAKKYGKLSVMRSSYKRAAMDAVSLKLKNLPDQTLVFLMQKAPVLDTTLSGVQARKAVLPLLIKDVTELCDVIIKKYAKSK